MMIPRIHLVLIGALAAGGCNVIKSDLLGDASAGDDSSQSQQDASVDAPSLDFPMEMLIANYEFEDGSGTVATETVRGMHGMLSDPSMWTTMGRHGGAISMNGATPATQYVSLPNGLLSGVDDFTISVWVKLTGNPAWARIYDIGNGLPDPQNRFMYLTTSGFSQDMPDGIHASSYGGSTSNESVIATHTYLPLNVWKHIALTGSGGERRLYIDGFPAMHLDSGPAIAPREMEPISPISWLGKSRFAADAGFPGVMDEFRIYSRVLTAAEIADLAWPNGDYSHWRFDESGGAAAKDTSDRGMPAALASGAAFATGRLGGGVSLTGGDAGGSAPHVVISGNPLEGCMSQFTIAAWIRISSYAIGSRVFDFGTGTTHSLYLSPNDGTGTHVGMKSPAGTFNLVTSEPAIPEDSTWHHVAVTMDGGNVVVLYVDGSPIKTQSSPSVRVSDFATSIDEAYLGRSRGTDPYFAGGIDELRIGCRALTPDEIKNLAYR
ncbi:MAG TPA: LamG domain-containing protein [Kofleriaceae bacterium]|nr:LamG domain-containing protein [Kofleriaceae bacterium]